VSRGQRDDRGDVSTQLVLLTPLLLFLVMVVVQLALWLHASNVGAAVAARGAAAAAVAGASPGDGESAAVVLAHEAGIQLASAPVVERHADVVTLRVQVRLARLLPGLPGTVTRVAEAPVERFIAEPSR
jgi:hypothetical protein